MSSLKPAHRKARASNLLQALFKYERIKTLTPRAREIQPLAEYIITMGKSGDIHSKRKVFKILQDRTIVKKIFNEISPRYKDRKGGYTRIIRVSPSRKGDSAPLAFIELIK